MDLDLLRTIGRVFYYGVCVAAILRGDRPLRYTGAAIMANALISPLSQMGHVPGGPYYGTMVIDVILVVVMSGFLLRDRRWWLVVSTACMMMSTLTHFAALIGTPINSYVTSTVRLLWLYGMIAALGWGLAQHELNRRCGGRADLVRALIAEQGESRARVELDRRYLTAKTPAERDEATRLVEALRQLTEAH